MMGFMHQRRWWWNVIHKVRRRTQQRIDRL
jgi:hypothetical protein